MELNVWIALVAGFASFISPCMLPLYPSYLSYITGISVSQLSAADNTREVRLRTLLHTFFFILGLSIVYYALGYAAGMIAEVFVQYRDMIRKLAALLIILMGLFLLGIFQPKLLMRDFKFNVRLKSASYLGSLLVGIGFAAGWSPCVGPILTAIIGLATSEPGLWLEMITAYTIGFAIPFFVLAFFIGSFRSLLKYSERIMKIGGAFMVVLGVLLFTGMLTRLTVWLNAITPSWLQF